MDTPNNTSRANGAFWVIAISMAVIAVCLVLIVARLERPTDSQEPVATSVKIEANTPAPVHNVPHSLNLDRTRRSVEEPSPAPEPEPVPVIAAIPPEPTNAPVAGVQPIVASGLAPLTSLGGSNAFATIAGRVKLKGTPSPETPIPFDPQCGKMHPKITTTQRYLISSDGGLANVFVFIKSGLEGRHFDPPTWPAKLAESGCLFQPSVLGMMVNQDLQIVNADKKLHTIHALPQSDANQAFNIAEKPGVMVTETFQAPETPVKLICDIHPWMFAYVFVMNNPFYAVTDRNGNYVISNVPPGDYVLEAYHIKSHFNHGGITEPVAATAGETVTANFTVELPSTSGRMAKRE